MLKNIHIFARWHCGIYYTLLIIHSRPLSIYMLPIELLRFRHPVYPISHSRPGFPDFISKVVRPFSQTFLTIFITRQMHRYQVLELFIATLVVPFCMEIIYLICWSIYTKINGFFFNHRQPTLHGCRATFTHEFAPGCPSNSPLKLVIC